ncbi:MAG: PilT/PilU family type 4a pilus ATPase [Candidatus Schekmanbacteria bacterium]|nr:PilT/PilU family type 4a pilus ATPase [Candidatus Schekmanbacteria bacterium]
MKIQELLEEMIRRDSSDIYITAELPPMYRTEGITERWGDKELTFDDTKALAYEAMSDRQIAEFEVSKEMNLALFYPELGRFRVNIFYQRGNVGMVIRQIKLEIKTIDDLKLPSILKDIIMTKRGLVLVVGATGSGKSTTLAAMIEHRNANSPGHIISIEDPIEFVHPHKKSVITQREVGFDTHSFGDALRNTLRQAPDVILIGEIRDVETMEAAITFAETGHLCLGTLHANNANQAIERVINFFPIERHPQVYLLLSLNIRAIVSQRLIPTIDGKRAAAMEVLLDTSRVKDLILKEDIGTLKDAMAGGNQEGMQTFDQSIFNLYKDGKISYENAIAYADSANDLRLRIKMDSIQDEQQQEQAQGKPGEKKEPAFRIKKDDPYSR